MGKAFESLFWSVTCLPGCFTLYRLWMPDRSYPRTLTDLKPISKWLLWKFGWTPYIWRTCFVLVKIDTWWLFFWNAFHFSRHSLSEMHMRSPWRRTIGRFYYFSVDIGSQSGRTCFRGAALQFLIVMIDLVNNRIPTLSLIMVAAVHGVQALVLSWDEVGWMIY